MRIRSGKTALQMRPLPHAVLLSLALLAPTANAQVVPFVDYYKTNVTANTTPATNAAVTLLSGYSQLWTTATWDTGAPTSMGELVMSPSQAYSVKITTERSAAESESAYLIDRRNQSFTAIEGLDDLADAFRTAAGATTTITSVAADATIGRYDDRGTGGGLSSSATVGRIVSLVSTVRGPFSSSNPSKNYFNSPRPWRLTDDNRVVVEGTETTGYYTSTLADGSPNYAGTITNFPDYSSNVVVAPALLPVRSVTPASDGGFVSGHTNAAYLASLSMTHSLPERYHDLLSNASDMGQDRILAGMHSTLDVIGGRMLATALSAAILSDPANATLKAEARTQGVSFVAANSSGSSRFELADVQSLAAHREAAELYAWRSTYGLPATGVTGVPAAVPKGAEVLLETRLPYLDAAQRREVLRTTAMRSGHVVQDDVEGWGRLNLFAAGDGYGSFDSNVTVNMDAAAGGFGALDAWRNDIGGVGALIKDGTGELILTGSNGYRGGTQIQAGTIVAASSKALGKGNVTNSGTLVNYAPGYLHIGDDYAQTDGATLEMVVGKGADGARRGLLWIDGDVRLDGHLRVQLETCPKLAVIPVMIFTGKRHGKFDDLEVESQDPAATCSYAVSYVGNSVLLTPRLH
jgi:autotransporter-associated beta strand protein